MIPEFLKPPTDNLYKFMAIVGLILFLVSATYPPWLFHRSALASYEAQKDSELLDLDITEAERKAKEFNDEMENAKSQRPIITKLLAGFEQRLAQKPSRSQATAILSEAHQAQSRLDEMDKKARGLYIAAIEASNEARRKTSELRYKLKVVQWENWYGRIAMILCLLGCIAGAVIGRTGFNLWSLRVQVHQDAILRNEAKAIEPAEKSQG